MRKLIYFIGIFLICGIILFFTQGTFCFGSECNPQGNSSTRGAGISGEILSPGSTPENDGIAYVPKSYEEEKADQQINDFSASGDGSESASESEGDDSPIASASVTSAPDNAIAGSGTATGISNGGIVNSLPIVQEECYGAEACNPTGNPIGGGAGYSRIISQTDPKVKYVVSTKEELLSALKKATSGEVVFIKGTAVIDMKGTANVIIPAGVTLASNRGLGGSQGALIKKSINTTNNNVESLFLAGDVVRVTGLRLEGEMDGEEDYSVPQHNFLSGVRALNAVEVDNCEIRGWREAGILSGIGSSSNSAYIHHNYIHHHKTPYAGYGVEVYGGNVLIEANIFDNNRHSIAASGVKGESYEARYNIELGHTYEYEHRFDVHANPHGEKYSGNSYMIHHNTFKNEVGTGYDIKYRGSEPELGIWIDHNLFNWNTAWDTRPVYSYALGAGQSKTYVTDNMVGIPPTTLKRDGNGIIQFPAV